MVGAIFGLVTILAGGYYLSRLAPRVLARNAAAAAGVSAYPVHLQYRAYEHAFQSTMTDREALLILGFNEEDTAPFRTPSKEAIQEKYRLCMTQLHSDVEGSSYVASKINEARDALVKSR